MGYSAAEGAAEKVTVRTLGLEEEDKFQGEDVSRRRPEFAKATRLPL